MKKKALFAAMSAGLLAGTGAGFVLGVPGLTSAAGDVETGSIDERSSDDADGRHGRGKGKGGKMGSPETLATALGVDTECSCKRLWRPHLAALTFSATMSTVGVV